jgi:hypothetical protein
MKKIIPYLLFLLASLAYKGVALANGPSIVPDGGKKESGNYALSDFVVVALNVARWVLIVSGSLALLAFVVGGFMFIFSGGNKAWVEKGKESIVGATIGLLIVLLAFTAVDYFLKRLGWVGAPFGKWNAVD